MPRTVTIAKTGQTLQFPDGAADDDILGAVSAYDAQQQQVQQFQQEPPMAQAIMKAIGPQFGFQVPEPDAFRLPVLKGNTFGMTPETLNNTLGIVQNTQNMNASERIRQRVQMEQQMEQEKDRAQQLKLEQQRMKNQETIEKMRERAEMDAERRKNKTGSVSNISGVGPVHMGIGEDGTPFATPIQMGNVPKPAPKWKETASEVTVLGEDGQPKMMSVWINELNPEEKIVVPLGTPAPKTESGFTLPPGSTRFGPDGKPIATAAPLAPRPVTPPRPARLSHEQAATVLRAKYPDVTVTDAEGNETLNPMYLSEYQRLITGTPWDGASSIPGTAPSVFTETTEGTLRWGTQQ